MESKELRKLRLSLDLKQREMAEKLGVSLPTYGLYERGQLVISKPVQMLAETMVNKN